MNFLQKHKATIILSTISIVLFFTKNLISKYIENAVFNPSENKNIVLPGFLKTIIGLFKNILSVQWYWWIITFAIIILLYFTVSFKKQLLKLNKNNENIDLNHIKKFITSLDKIHGEYVEKVNNIEEAKLSYLQHGKEIDMNIYEREYEIDEHFKQKIYSINDFYFKDIRRILEVYIWGIRRNIIRRNIEKDEIELLDDVINGSLIVFLESWRQIRNKLISIQGQLER